MNKKEHRNIAQGFKGELNFYLPRVEIASDRTLSEEATGVCQDFLFHFVRGFVKSYKLACRLAAPYPRNV